MKEREETHSEPGNEIVSVLSLLKTGEGHLGSRDVPERGERGREGRSA